MKPINKKVRCLSSEGFCRADTQNITVIEMPYSRALSPSWVLSNACRQACIVCRQENELYMRSTNHRDDSHYDTLVTKAAMVPSKQGMHAIRKYANRLAVSTIN